MLARQDVCNSLTLPVALTPQLFMHIHVIYLHIHVNKHTFVGSCRALQATHIHLVGGGGQAPDTTHYSFSLVFLYPSEKSS